MIDITLANFETEVVAASMDRPVLLDIWAEWCGPCKQLGPVLEQLEVAYEGRFVLAKLDADKVPEISGQLSQMFGVRSIPFCILFKEGQPVDGFVGALPASQVRTFLDKHVPSEALRKAEAGAEEAQQQLASGDVQGARARLAEALAAEPANNDLRFDYAKLLIAEGHLDEAAGVLAPAMAQIPVELRFEALTQWLNALEFVANDPRGQWTLAQFDDKLSENKRDFETRFAKGRLLIAQGDWTAAMEELLEIILRDKQWNEEAPRKTYVALLELLTPPRPKAGADQAGKAGGIELAGKAALQEDPQAALVSAYRRKLSMALN